MLVFDELIVQIFFFNSKLYFGSILKNRVKNHIER